MDLSIIIPVYNMVGYLDDCLQSIVTQPLGDYRVEVLCIDDGSTDGSAALLDQYADWYAFVRVFHQANKGVSVARNVGLAMACGEYVWFVDSDDCLVQNAIVELLGIAYERRVKLLRFGYETFGSAYRKMSSTGRSSNLRLTGRGELYAPSLWCQLFKRSLLGHRFNEQMAYGEDGLFAAQVQFQVFPYWVMDRVYYRYRLHEGSLTHQKNPQSMRRVYESLLIFHDELVRNHAFYCQNETTAEAYERLLAGVRSGFMFELCKCESSELMAYYQKAVQGGVYPYRAKVRHIVQMPEWKLPLTVNVHIVLADLIKLVLMSGHGVGVFNRLFGWFY